MNGLLHLTSDDFYVQKGANGNLLCHSIPGFSLILFYSTQCKFCQSVIPIFKKLPGTVNGCQFGIINVSNNKTCVIQSKSTIAPIEYVPYIVLYVDKRPYMIYKGPYDCKELSQFVVEVAGNLQKKRSFITGPTEQKGQRGQRKKRDIPEFTVGIPVYGQSNDPVCYLEFDNAYEKK